MKTVEVLVSFHGRTSGTIGICYPIQARRKIEIPDDATETEIKEKVHMSLYYPQGDDKGFERICDIKIKKI